MGSEEAYNFVFKGEYIITCQSLDSSPSDYKCFFIHCYFWSHLFTLQITLPCLVLTQRCAITWISLSRLGLLLIFLYLNMHVFYWVWIKGAYRMTLHVILAILFGEIIYLKVHFVFYNLRRRSFCISTISVFVLDLQQQCYFSKKWTRNFSDELKPKHWPKAQFINSSHLNNT